MGKGTANLSFPAIELDHTGEYASKTIRFLN
jgi:hypothetical protein